MQWWRLLREREGKLRHWKIDRTQLTSAWNQGVGNGRLAEIYTRVGQHPHLTWCVTTLFLLLAWSFSVDNCKWGPEAWGASCRAEENHTQCMSCWLLHGTCFRNTAHGGDDGCHCTSLAATGWLILLALVETATEVSFLESLRQTWIEQILKSSQGIRRECEALPEPQDLTFPLQ